MEILLCFVRNYIFLKFSEIIFMFKKKNGIFSFRYYFSFFKQNNNIKNILKRFCICIYFRDY